MWLLFDVFIGSIVTRQVRLQIRLLPAREATCLPFINACEDLTGTVQVAGSVRRIGAFTDHLVGVLTARPDRRAAVGGA